jgi:hypothetical protein
VDRFVFPQFLVSLMLAASPGGIAPTPPAPITLFARFDHEVPSEIEQEMHHELDAIMSPLGLRFEWRSVDSVTGQENIVDLAVLTFKGECDVSGFSPGTPEAGALGWTHVSDGAILPFSDIDCDRIHSFLQRDLLGVPRIMRAPAYAKAVARVLAHELYHIFGNTPNHAASGVAEEAFTVKELLSQDFHFEGPAAQVLRKTRAHGLFSTRVAH